MGAGTGTGAGVVRDLGILCIEAFPEVLDLIAFWIWWLLLSYIGWCFIQIASVL